MTIPTGHPDWLPAIAVVDAPEVIETITGQGVPFTSGAFDVRRWASFHLNIGYEAPNAGPPANTGVVALEWGDDNVFTNVITKHEYEINSINSTDCGMSQISDGHYGPFMRYALNAGAGAGSTFSGVILGSNRPFTKTRSMERAPTGNRGLSNDRFLVLFSEVVGAGVVIQRNVRLGVGPGTIHINSFAGAGPFDVSLHTPQYGLNGGRVFSALAIAAPQSQTYQLTMPRRVTCLRVANNGGAAVTVLVTLIIDDN